MPESSSGRRPDPSPELGVVVPFRDEQDVLPILVEQLYEQLEVLSCTYEVVMVDDGSTDASWSLLEDEVAAWPELVLVRLTRRFGKEGAIQAGLAQSSAAAVVVMDADLQHPPDLIGELWSIWESTDAWVVEAVKRGTERPSSLDRLGIDMFYRLLERLTELPMRNRSDFQLLDRRAVNLLLAIPERVTIFRGIVAWLGLPTRQISFEVPDRPAGESKWSLRALGRLGLDMITGFTNAPLRVMAIASIGFVVLAGLLSVQTLYVYLTGRAVEGFTTVILTVLITGAALSVGLGIIGEYLARIYEEVKRRPRYVVEELCQRAESEDG